jgi:integrase/recombinase XerD
MHDHLLSYFHFIQLEKGLSANTIASYRIDLDRYLEYLEQLGVHSVEGIEESHVTGFLSTLKNLGLASNSVSRNFSSIRGFHHFLVAEGISKNEPTQNIDSPRLTKRLPGVLTQSEVDRILSQPDVNEPLGLRDKAILELMYATGVRVSELTTLKQSNLMFDTGIIRVMGKGSKERIIPIGRSAIRYVQLYQKQVRIRLAKRMNSSDCLFLNFRGKLHAPGWD